MVDYAERMLEGWRAGEVRDIHADMTRLTLEIIAKTLFDADVRAERRVGAALPRHRRVSWPVSSVLPLPEWVPTPRNLPRTPPGRQPPECNRLSLHRPAPQEWRAPRRPALNAAGCPGRRRRSHGRPAVARRGNDAVPRRSRYDGADALLGVVRPGPDARGRCQAGRRTASGPWRASAVAGRLPRLRYAEHVVRESMRLYPPAYAIGREARSAWSWGATMSRRGRRY